MKPLILNNKPFSLEQIIKFNGISGQSDLIDYECRVLAFCQSWLSGQETFTLQTSGSTGKPKSITITRAQMTTSAQLTGQALKLQSGDRALVCLSVDYVAGIMMLVRGFELGLQLTVINPTSNPLAKFQADTRFDFTAMVPLQLQEILAGSAAEIAILNDMKAILIGGAPISVALEEAVQAIDAPIYHTYGMTETVSHIALRRLNGPDRSEAFVPFEGVDLALDERGCLSICSALTQGEVLQTNDLVILRSDGSFVWLGRIDHVINSGGVKVHAERVEIALEKVLYRYQGGAYADRRFFVGSLSHTRYGETVIAVFEGEPFSEETEQAIQAKLQKILSKYEMPREFYFRSRLTETPTGKIDRLANLAYIAQLPD